MVVNAVQFENQPVQIHKRVFFTGDTALPRGWGLDYDADRGTDTVADGKRNRYVELPTTSNNMHFAGVTQRAYSAVVGGQWVDIFEPGSTCCVAIGVDTVVDSTLMTCSCTTADAGRFTQAGYKGRGTALALQTNASGQLTGETDGTGSLASDGITLTGVGFVTGAVAAGDLVYIVGGEKQAAVVAAIVPGVYTVASVTSATVLVLTSAANDATAATVCNYYVISADAPPTALAYLFDGEESGLQEWLSPIDGGTPAAMVGGVTNIPGGMTYSADSTDVLADPTYMGERKGFIGWGTITTKGYKNSPTSALVLAGTSMTSFLIDAANECIHFVGARGGTTGIWKNVASDGVTEA